MIKSKVYHIDNLTKEQISDKLLYKIQTEIYSPLYTICMWQISLYIREDLRANDLP